MVIITDKELAELQDNTKNQLIAKVRLLEYRYQQLLAEMHKKELLAKMKQSQEPKQEINIYYNVIF